MDDTDIAELVSPTLTSVDLGAARRAATAAELLLDRLGDGDAPARRITVAPVAHDPRVVVDELTRRR